MTPEEFKDTQSSIIRTTAQKYAWPGGYPLFAVTKDNYALCPECVEKNKDLIIESEYDPQWTLTSVEVNWENLSLFCCHCNSRIESAYGDD
jgi:hypothetical protein